MKIISIVLDPFTWLTGNSSSVLLVSRIYRMVAFKWNFLLFRVFFLLLFFSDGGFIFFWVISKSLEYHPSIINSTVYIDLISLHNALQYAQGQMGLLIIICMLMPSLIFTRIDVLAFQPKKPLAILLESCQAELSKRSNFGIDKSFWAFCWGSFR